MKKGEEYWHFQESGLGARVSRSDPSLNEWDKRARDVRWLGIAPATRSLETGTGFEAIYGPQSNPTERIVAWDERREGSLRVATATFTSGARVEWQIDPDKGWNATRSRVVAVDGSVRAESVCTLKEYDGVWLPQTVEYYQAGRLHERVTIQSARLNRVDDPASFNAGDLNLEPGDTVISLNTGAPPVRWNGSNLVSLEQWDADVQAGRSHWSARREAINRGEPFSSPYDTEAGVARRIAAQADQRRASAINEHVTPWGRYVERFIQRYELNQDQSARARQILRVCEDQADEYIVRVRVDLDRAIARVEEARNAGSDEQLAMAQKQLEKLREPIAGIFERDLKPRLDTLPTRAQRKAAEAPGTSDKADKPRP
jgi:hypothetical protein